MAFHLNKLETPSLKMFVLSLVEIVPGENVKSLQTKWTYRQTHERRTTGNQKISCELIIEIYGSKQTNELKGYLSSSVLVVMLSPPSSLWKTEKITIL